MISKSKFAIIVKIQKSIWLGETMFKANLYRSEIFVALGQLLD
jgi:hypothetical protein